MMNYYKIRLFSLALFLMFSTVWSQQNHILQSVMSTGGGTTSSVSYSSISIVGQPVVGKDSSASYHTSGGFSSQIEPLRNTLPIYIQKGWNMVSVSRILNDYRKIILFPTAVSASYNYNDGYHQMDTLEPGSGYWMKFPDAGVLLLQGTGFYRETLQVAQGWNMVGALSAPVKSINALPIAPLTIQTQFYGFNPSIGYQPTDTLYQGKAYWVKVSQAGKIVVATGGGLEMSLTRLSNNKQGNSSNLKAITSSGIDDFKRLIIRDAEGHSKILLFTSSYSDVNLNQYELPPTPPTEIFDVRYKSQRYLEIPIQGVQEKNKFPIVCNSVTYPLTISWEEPSEATLVINGKVHSMKTTGKIIIDDPDASINLSLSPSSIPDLPMEYALQQNYPNPFNPTTTIQYSLPTDSYVKLTMYNVIGEQVTSLVDEIQNAGYKSVNFDGSSVASGVYYYRFQTTSIKQTDNTYTNIRKMLLVK